MNDELKNQIKELQKAINKKQWFQASNISKDIYNITTSQIGGDYKWENIKLW